MHLVVASATRRASQDPSSLYRDYNLCHLDILLICEATRIRCLCQLLGQGGYIFASIVAALFGPVPALFGIVPMVFGIVPAFFGIVPALFGIVPVVFGIVPVIFGIVPDVCVLACRFDHTLPREGWSLVRALFRHTQTSSRSVHALPWAAPGLSGRLSASYRCDTARPWAALASSRVVSEKTLEFVSALAPFDSSQGPGATLEVEVSVVFRPALVLPWVSQCGVYPMKQGFAHLIHRHLQLSQSIITISKYFYLPQEFEYNDAWKLNEIIARIRELTSMRLILGSSHGSRSSM